MSLSLGTRLGSYEVTALIGQGGMGEVYRARDTKLHRDVALKVLTKQADDAAARLLQEARAASALNHPNVCTIHEVGEHEGQAFIVMEHVEGKPLSQLIPSDGLPPETVIRYATQIADALAHAHERGIVHRDLKSANVVITSEGRAKVLDFGLATRLPQADAEAVTKTQEALPHAGMLVGTLAYMAPEVLRREAATARSDIWALGVLLYEMASGRLPFGGDTAYALTAAILHESPAPLSATVPALLQNLIQRCLEKERRHRHQRANEVRAILEAMLGQPVTASPARGSLPPSRRKGRRRTGPIKSLAVLPLANLSPDPDQEYFADGMTEALIADLAQIGALRVISRTSAMRYRGTNKSLPEIAHELNVDGLIEGSVLRAGERVRITAQLIHAATDTHVWAHSYERDLRDILGLQAEVARAVADEIKVKVTPQERTRLTARRCVNPQAHQAYLKGRYFWNQRGPGLKKSIELFEQALAEDANYAPAYAGLADACALVGFYGYSPPREVMPKAKDAARKALEIDEGLAEAHCSLGYIHTIFDWEWKAARREFQRALELNPNYGLARDWYSVWLWFMGHFEEAIAEVRRGLETDPVSAYMHVQLGCVLLAAQKYAQASEPLLQALELEPDFASARSILGIAYYFQSRIEDAVREIQRAIDVSHRDQWPVGSLGVVYAATGDRTRAEEILVELEGRAQNEYIHASWIAAIYALLDEKDEAFEWLEKAYNERAPVVASCALKTWPGWLYNSLRADSRFQDLVRRLGLNDGE